MVINQKGLSFIVHRTALVARSTGSAG